MQNFDDEKLYYNEERLKFVLETLGKSNSDIAKDFGVTEALVSQLKNYTLEKLKPLHLYAFNSHYGIPLEIFEGKSITKGEIRALLNKEENKIFEQNREVLSLLTAKNDGIWYFYSYPSDYDIEKNNVRIVKTKINNDFTTADMNFKYENRGKIYISETQTMLIKKAYNSKNLISITFDNRKIPYEPILFSLSSIANGGDKKMLNFGFCSQSLFDEEKIKEILGDIEKVQLKIDLAFVDKVEGK